MIRMKQLARPGVATIALFAQFWVPAGLQARSATGPAEESPVALAQTASDAGYTQPEPYVCLIIDDPNVASVDSEYTAGLVCDALRRKGFPIGSATRDPGYAEHIVGVRLTLAEEGRAIEAYRSSGQERVITFSTVVTEPSQLTEAANALASYIKRSRAPAALDFATGRTIEPGAYICLIVDDPNVASVDSEYTAGLVCNALRRRGLNVGRPTRDPGHAIKIVGVRFTLAETGRAIEAYCSSGQERVVTLSTVVTEPSQLTEAANALATHIERSRAPAAQGLATGPAFDPGAYICLIVDDPSVATLDSEKAARTVCETISSGHTPVGDPTRSAEGATNIIGVRLSRSDEGFRLKAFRSTGGEPPSWYSTPMEDLDQLDEAAMTIARLVAPDTGVPIVAPSRKPRHDIEPIESKTAFLLSVSAESTTGLGESATLVRFNRTFGLGFKFHTTGMPFIYSFTEAAPVLYLVSRADKHLVALGVGVGWFAECEVLDCDKSASAFLEMHLLFHGDRRRSKGMVFEFGRGKDSRINLGLGFELAEWVR